MFRHSQRLFRTLPNTKNSFTKPLQLRMPLHRNFCEQPGNNYHNIMQSSEKKFPTVSVLVGALLALGFGYYQFALHNPDDKKESPKINQAKADLNNPAGAQVSKELRKEIGAQDQDDINTALRLRETAKTNFAQDKYDEVTDLLELALEVLRGANQGNSIHSADVYFDLGFYSLHNNDIAKARDAFNKAFEVYSNNGNDERGFDSLDMLTLTYDKDPAGGEAAFEKIIKKRLEKGGPADPALANAYIQYGLWQIKNSKDKEGIKLLGKASEVLEKNNGKSKHEDLAPVYNNLVNAYREAKAYPEGVHVSKSAIKFLDVNKNPALLNDIANLYSEGNDSQKSVEFYRKYLDALKASGKDGYEKGKIIKNIASEYEKQKADKEALATWKEFSGLFDKADSKEVQLMSVYGQLRAFALYNRRGKVGEATKELEDASSKTEKLMGKEHMYSQTMKKALERYKGNHAGNEQAKLDLDSLTLILIALEDNLQKLIDTGYIIV